MFSSGCNTKGNGFFFFFFPPFFARSYVGLRKFPRRYGRREIPRRSPARSRLTVRRGQRRQPGASARAARSRPPSSRRRRRTPPRLQGTLPEPRAAARGQRAAGTRSHGPGPPRSGQPPPVPTRPCEGGERRAGGRSSRSRQRRCGEQRVPQRGAGGL